MCLDILLDSEGMIENNKNKTIINKQQKQKNPQQYCHNLFRSLKAL